MKQRFIAELRVHVAQIARESHKIIEYDALSKEDSNSYSNVSKNSAERTLIGVISQIDGIEN